MAEGQGFEPWVPFGTLVFKTSAFDHSATPPKEAELYRHIDARQGLPAQFFSLLLVFSFRWCFCFAGPALAWVIAGPFDTGAGIRHRRRC